MVNLDLNISGKVEISGGYDNGTIDVEFEVEEAQIIGKLLKQFNKEYLLFLIEELQKEVEDA